MNCGLLQVLSMIETPHHNTIEKDTLTVMQLHLNLPINHSAIFLSVLHMHLPVHRFY